MQLNWLKWECSINCKSHEAALINQSIKLFNHFNLKNYILLSSYANVIVAFGMTDKYTYNKKTEHIRKSMSWSYITSWDEGIGYLAQKIV